MKIWTVKDFLHYDCQRAFTLPLAHHTVNMLYINSRMLEENFLHLFSELRPQIFITIANICILYYFLLECNIGYTKNV